MSNFSSARDLIAAVAGPKDENDTRQSWLARAARRAGISYRTVRAVFYGEISDPDHPCVRLLQLEAQRRIVSAADRVEALARSMEKADPEFYAADVAALREAALSMRRSGNRLG